MSVNSRTHGIRRPGEDLGAAVFNITDVMELDGGFPFDGHPPNGMQYPDIGDNKRKRDNFLLNFVGQGSVKLAPPQSVVTTN